MPLAVALLVLAWAGGGTGVEERDDPGWTLAVHVGLMLAGFAGFTVAAAMAALYLWEERRLKRRDTRVFRLPPLEALDRLAGRVALAGGAADGRDRRRADEPRPRRLRRRDGRRALHLGALRRRPRAPPRSRATRPQGRDPPAARLRARRRRAPSHPFRLVKLALVGVSHHQAPVELRERVAVDLEGARAVAGELGRRPRGRRALDVQPHRALPRVRRTTPTSERASEALLELAGDAAGALAPVPTGSPTSPPRCTSSASPPVSTRSCPARARSSARCATRTRRARPGPLLDRLFRQALHAGRRARVETAIGESPASVPAAAAALAQQVFGASTAARSSSSGQAR